ncbi:ferrous iron transport protein A [Campylobacter coli]|nr:ferrous iron transport protein A [Campylobacter coli]
MTLNELKDGQKAIIVNLNAHKELKNRLLSFGFIKKLEKNSLLFKKCHHNGRT